MTREQASATTWGLVLIALGIVFLGDRLDWMPGFGIHRLWPVLIIIAGLVRLTVPNPAGPRQGIGFVLVGGIFLMHTTRYLPLHDSWPMFIVVAGVVMLLEGLFSKPARKES
jgi:hypothetical protein